MNARTISGWIRSNILGFVAIFIALTGTAVALPGTDTVESDDIIDGEVHNADIHANAITGDKIGLGQVDSPQLHGDSVTSNKIADGAVAAADVAPNSLGGGQVDEASLDSTVLQHRLASGCASGSAIRTVDASGNVTCEPTTGGSGGGPPTGPAGGDLTGNYPNPTIAANAVGSSEIADGAVGGFELAPNSVGSGNIVTSGVGNSDLAPNSVTSSKIADASVFGSAVSDGTLTGSDVANTSSLNGNDIDESSLDIAVGKTARDGSLCSGNNDGGTCASMTFTMPRAGHVMLIGSGDWVTFEFDDPNQTSDPGNSVQMDCHLQADGTGVGSPTFFGEKQTSFGATPVHEGIFPGNFTLTGITGTLGAGSHTFILSCFKDDGDIDVRNARITALAID